MDIYSQETTDGLRFVFNNLPSTKVQQTRAVLPIGTFYTPFKEIENASLEYDPLRCRCSAILNPFCTVDYKSKFWICALCANRNGFPKHYADHISEQSLPAELLQESTTIEYISGSSQSSPLLFLYVIDTCIPIEELNSIRDSIQQQLDIIPQNSLIGLITFNRNVFVHELGFSQCPKSYCFKGTKEYTTQQIVEMLQIGKNEINKRFFLPLQECQFILNSILDDLQNDPWPVTNQERPQRGSGSALNIGLILSEMSNINSSRLLFFCGGPCTIGPGIVVGLKNEETIRSYMDISQDNECVKYLKTAKKFYQTIAQRAINSNTVVDIFAFTLDQYGLLEMKVLSEKTGGIVVSQEKFESDVFKETYKKLFDRDKDGNLKMGFGAKITFLSTKEIKVQGAIGPCNTLKKQGTNLSDQSIGEGGTNQWQIGGVDKNLTLLFILDLASTLMQANNQKLAFLQFQTIYKHSDGRIRLRVTTTSKRFADQNNLTDLIKGFDQESACVLLARMGVLKCESEESFEVMKWLDRTLIRLVSRFGDYKKDDPLSFRLGKEFELFPQFMFHLRRSHFIQTFGASPDETSFYRCSLMRENITNSLVMIQPALLEYTFDSLQPTPVLLDIENLRDEVILLLDTYFNVVVWWGDKIKKWKDAKYDENQDYEYFKQLLEAPTEDVKLIVEDRFPVPNVIYTWQGHGKERYLKSRVNPSVSHNNVNVDSGQYITDDASLKVFTDHLTRLAVSTPS